MKPKSFVEIPPEFKTRNYYWYNGEVVGITRETLMNLGIGEQMYWHPIMTAAMTSVQDFIRLSGFDILINGAWRANRLYDLIEKNRSDRNLPPEEKYNLRVRPHSTGLAVDAELVNLKTGALVPMRSYFDGHSELGINFYKNSDQKEEKRFYWLQQIMIGGFARFGFRLGSKQEYWHFEHPLLTDESERY